MADDQIRYDILAQDALRSVMRKVLTEVARTGLPGNHHFFITFVTGAPGVRISRRMREKYPDQMTIVLQYQYWDLKVSEHEFEVGLSFAEVPEKLTIPFAAVRGFYDPSVNFELEFDVDVGEEAMADGDGETTALPAVADSKAATRKKKKKSDPKKAEPGSGDDGADGDAPKKGAEVVSLDSFRKK